MDSLQFEKTYADENQFEEGMLAAEISPIVENLYASDDTKKLRINELSLRYKVDERKLLWKIDFHVVLPFALILFISFLCRSNIGILQIEGIYFSLGITQLQLFSSYAAFFVPYILFQFVSNIILKRVRPHFWISLSILCYGAVTLATGWVKTYGQFVACQFLHGLFQSGVETALYYILAQYYEKFEAQKRFSFVYSISCVAGAVSTSIAYSIDIHIAYTHNLEGWRWLMIIEGAMAMFSSFILFFSIPDFPENARFMDDNETSFLVKKLEIYQGKSGFDLEISNRELVSMFTDPLVLLPAIASIGICFATYVYAFFESFLIREITLTSIEEANKYSVFPWIVAFVYVNLNSYLSDLVGLRFPFIIVNVLVAIAGGAMIFTPTIHETFSKVKYAGCFLCCAGAYTANPLLICWTSTNLGGHTRKNIGVTMLVSFGSIGGLVSIFPFLREENNFEVGFATGFTLFLCGSAFIVAYAFVIRHMNAIKRTNEYKFEFSELSQRKQIILGDKNPAFDYMF